MSVAHAVRRRRMARGVAPLAALLALTCSGCGGCGGSETLDSALDQADQQVQGALDSGQESADGVLVAAASQAQVALADARVAWSGQLGESVDDLDAETAGQLDELQQMSDELEQGTKSGAAAAATAAHRLARTMTVADGTPQVSGFGPELAATGTEVPLRLRVRGDFPSASRRGYRPALRAGDLPAALKENTTRELGFDVPPPAIRPGHGIGALPLTLTVPYPDGARKPPPTARFHLTLSVLPASPGRVTIETAPAAPRGTVTRRLASATARADSRYARADVNRPVGPVFADPGCRIATGSARIVVTSSRGEEGTAWTRSWVGRDPHSVEAHIGTVWKGSYASGAVEAHVEAGETCPLVLDGRREVVPRLRWGDQARFSVARARRWWVGMAPFHGSELTLGGTESTARTPYLAVTCCSARGTVAIRVPDVSGIGW